ncbi:MAG TPA: pyridoxamine 5'-phosphate oxidase family protein [Nitrososphaeraceae archaeon]|jgi:nitroimidazol reductase NimA-like FMN-containing flavoprotein (pyridoxamine 5'-phosphate oxidase superfamily)
MNKIIFTPLEEEFLLMNEGCRIATVTPDNNPHIVPVSYIYEKGRFYFATDYNTKKYKNLKKNPTIAIAVDIYSSVNNSAVIVYGKAHFIEYGEKFQELYSIFHKKFEWVRTDPWEEGEAPFIEVEPFKKVCWGIENFFDKRRLT